MEPILEKRCTRCGEIKNVSEFSGKKKLECRCKVCARADAKAYRIANQDKVKESQKVYRYINRDRRNEQRRAWYKTNRSKALAYCKKWNKANREWHNNRQKELRKNDLKIRLNINMGNSIRKSIRSGKGKEHWEGIVGYTIENLKRHLEKKFKQGMSWENYGKWHIDHIVPISVWNFETPEHEDFKRCWALKNLQPLWAEENLKKRAKLTCHFQPFFAF